MMLALVVVAIMLGFPTAFTLMGMGMIFTWLAYGRDINRTLDLMVQAAFKVMSNDVLISIPLFVFMGYLVERANLIDKLFRSLHLAMARVPGSLAVATLFTCAVFATATGIVGAVVTLMGLLALPQMLQAPATTCSISAGAITAGGCLGILIPPSVMLIVYGATAGVSVVQLYAGAFFPGLMLAGLYIVYVIILPKLRPKMAPPLTAEQRMCRCRAAATAGRDDRQARAAGVAGARAARAAPTCRAAMRWRQLGIALLPALLVVALVGLSYGSSTEPQRLATAPRAAGAGLSEPPGTLREPPRHRRIAGTTAGVVGGLREPPAAGRRPARSRPVRDRWARGAAGRASGGVREPPGARRRLSEPRGRRARAACARRPRRRRTSRTPRARDRPLRPPSGSASASALLALVGFYALLSFQRLEVFKMLLTQLLPAGGADPRGAGLDRVRAGHADRGGRRGRFGGYVLAASTRWSPSSRPPRPQMLLLWGLLWLPAFVADRLVLAATATAPLAETVMPPVRHRRQ